MTHDSIHAEASGVSTTLSKLIIVNLADVEVKGEGLPNQLYQNHTRDQQLVKIKHGMQAAVPGVIVASPLAPQPPSTIRSFETACSEKPQSRNIYSIYRISKRCVCVCVMCVCVRVHMQYILYSLMIFHDTSL